MLVIPEIIIVLLLIPIQERETVRQSEQHFARGAHFKFTDQPYPY